MASHESSDTPIEPQGTRRSLTLVLQKWTLYVTVLMAALAIYSTFALHPRKAIEVRAVSSPIVAAPINVSGDKLQIFFDGHQTTAIARMSVQISNGGSVPILPSDVEKPVRIMVAPSRVLDASIVSKHPRDLRAELILEPSAVVVRTGVFNSGDSLGIDILLDGRPKNFWVAGRISGLRKIAVDHLLEPVDLPPVLMVPLPRRLELAVVLTASLIGVGGLLLMIPAFRAIARDLSGAKLRELIARKVAEKTRDLPDYAQPAELEHTRRAAAERVYHKLPSRLRTRAWNASFALSMTPEMTRDDLSELLTAAIQEAVVRPGFSGLRERFEWEGLFFTLLVLVVSVLLILLGGGAVMRLLS